MSGLLLTVLAIALAAGQWLWHILAEYWAVPTAVVIVALLFGIAFQSKEDRVAMGIEGWAKFSEFAVIFLAIAGAVRVLHFVF